VVRHCADFRVRVYIMEVVKWLKYFTTKIILVLAPYRTVEIKSSLHAGLRFGLLESGCTVE